MQGCPSRRDRARGSQGDRRGPAEKSPERAPRQANGIIAAVLDTNVLASGIIGFSNVSSAPGRILRAWRGGGFNLVLSEHIIVELARNLLSTELPD
ncbi:MAG: PIN domain-containing protein [Chloroflexota bacterium]